MSSWIEFSEIYATQDADGIDDAGEAQKLSPTISSLFAHSPLAFSGARA
jgi:hypothetical protein